MRRWYFNKRKQYLETSKFEFSSAPVIKWSHSGIINYSDSCSSEPRALKTAVFNLWVFS
jgi:hypothetical protein